MQSDPRPLSELPSYSAPGTSATQTHLGALPQESVLTSANKAEAFLDKQEGFEGLLPVEPYALHSVAVKELFPPQTINVFSTSIMFSFKH